MLNQFLLETAPDVLCILAPPLLLLDEFELEHLLKLSLMLGHDLLLLPLPLLLEVLFLLLLHLLQRPHFLVFLLVVAVGVVALLVLSHLAAEVVVEEVEILRGRYDYVVLALLGLNEVFEDALADLLLVLRDDVLVVLVRQVVVDYVVERLRVQVRQTLHQLLTPLVVLNGLQDLLVVLGLRAVLLHLLSQRETPILNPYLLLQLLVGDDDVLFRSLSSVLILLLLVLVASLLDLLALLWVLEVQVLVQVVEDLADVVDVSVKTVENVLLSPVLQVKLRIVNLLQETLDVAVAEDVLLEELLVELLKDHVALQFLMEDRLHEEHPHLLNPYYRVPHASVELN